MARKRKDAIFGRYVFDESRYVEFVMFRSRQSPCRAFAIATVLLAELIFVSRGNAQEAQEKLTETQPPASSSPAVTVPWARAQLRKSSGIWLPPGSTERMFHELALKTLRDAKDLNNFISELEREKSTATTESDPPLAQVLAGLYAAQQKAEIKRKLYLEAWEKKPQDPWLNLKVAEEFHVSNQPDRMVQALSLVWEQAPEMILYEAGRVGSWYASTGRLDGVLESLTRLESRKPPLEGESQWQRFLGALQSGKLSVEQLEPIRGAVLKLANPATRLQIARQQAAVLMSAQKYHAAYDILSKEIFFNPVFITKEQSESSAATAAAHAAVFSVSEFANAASQGKRLESLAKDARSLLELSPAWKHVGELLVAVVAQRQGDEKPLIELAQRVRHETRATPANAPRDRRVFVLQQELSTSKSRTALQLGLEWKQADEPQLVASGIAMGMLRHEQALIHVRLGALAEARKSWLSFIAAPKSDQELQALNYSADQLRLHGFYEDALPLYRQLLHDWLPAHPDTPLKQHLHGVARHTVGLILEQLKDKWTTFTPEQQHKLLEQLLDLLFADGRDAEPLLPIKFAGQPDTPTNPGSPSPASPLASRPDAIPELAPAVLSLALATNELAKLREDWTKHPSQDSVALLTLRAEAAATAEDANDLARLMTQLRRIEQDSGQAPPFWSVRCLLQGLSDNLKEAFTFDFRDRKLDRKVFDISGQSPWLVKPEAEGLRIRLPANAGSIGHVGVKSRFHIHGDFEAVATYVILEILNPAPPKFYGGAMLIAEFADSAEHANIRRERHPTGAEFYAPHHHSLTAQEQVRTVIRHIPTGAMKGQLALVRRGSTMYWLVKDDAEADFRLLQQDACGSQDINTIKVAIDSWGTQSLTDIRWLDLTIRAEKFFDLPPEYLRKPTQVIVSGLSLAPATSRHWLWWIVGGVTTALLMASAVYWYRVMH